MPNRAVIAVLPLLLLAFACGGSSATEANPDPAGVREVRPAEANCADEGRLVFVRKLELDEDDSGHGVVLKGLDVTTDAIHLVYAHTEGMCEWALRTLRLDNGEPTSELRGADSCGPGAIEGGLAVIDGAHYVRGTASKQTHILRLDEHGTADVGPLPPSLEPHLGTLDGHIVSMSSDGHLSSLTPGDAAPSDLGAITRPSWGPSVGPEIEGDRIWLLRQAFEEGMTNMVGLTHMSDRAKFCTFETEDVPGLRGRTVQWFAARGEHLYIATGDEAVNGASRLSIVELALVRE